ncbi:MAG: hypothetical protein ACYSUI_22530 [Planctomycetota bacterium]
MDSFEVAAADIDADGDTVVLARLPKNARILSIKLLTDDLDTGTDIAWNVGLYEGGTTAATPGTVIDEDRYASAVTNATLSGTNALTEVYGESTDDTDSVDEYGNELYSHAGDTDGDFANYDIVLTQTAAAAGAAAGTIAFSILYTVD